MFNPISLFIKLIEGKLSTLLLEPVKARLAVGITRILFVLILNRIDWLGGQISDAGDWISNLLGGGAGGGASALGGAAPSFGVLASDIAPQLGFDVAASLGGGAAGAGAGAAEGAAGIASGLAGGGAIPIAAGVAILTNIIMDEINDPKGKVSAMQDYNYLTQQDMPTQLASLKAASSMLPKITNDLTDEQALAMYKVARAAVKNSERLADPLSMQGQREAGVQYGRYPGAAEIVQQSAPDAILATIRLQDLLDNRVLRDLDAAERTQGFLSLAGALCHAQLKQEQGIRGSVLDHDAKMQLLVVRIFTKIERLAFRHNINIAQATAHIWDTVVSKRDFIKNKQTGIV